MSNIKKVIEISEVDNGYWITYNEVDADSRTITKRSLLQFSTKQAVITWLSREFGVSI